MLVHRNFKRIALYFNFKLLNYKFYSLLYTTKKRFLFALKIGQNSFFVTTLFYFVNELNAK